MCASVPGGMAASVLGIPKFGLDTNRKLTQFLSAILGEVLRSPRVFLFLVDCEAPFRYSQAGQRH